MRRAVLMFALALAAHAQVYSPKVLRRGQPDATDLRLLAQGIYEQAGARTPRERAEAVWRFFLTDGRFVKPGFWYHIAGWAYEEPRGEVLDPLKLLNSYGFGLCYQIAPVLEAVWKAGGFEDARVWFLTGHTVAEVFYDGAYHHFDSDMMGYTTVGRGPVKTLPVASVRQLERDRTIILSRLKGPRDADRSAVDDPWYPADVREGAMDGLAGLFTTTGDNRLFPFERAPQGHRMDFELRPGERLIRYFRPERAGLFYLPYKLAGGAWQEFPQEIASYKIRTEDGPRSQKDARLWGTGRIEYSPPPNVPVYEVRSPYVIIDAEFRLDATLGAGESVRLETSIDGGRTWDAAGRLEGPHRGNWTAEPAVLTRSAHGRRTAVSGQYGYLVRLGKSAAAQVGNLLISTRIQLNPRTLPELAPGRNELVYSAGPARRTHVLAPDPVASSNARRVADGAQGFWLQAAEGPAEFVYRLVAPDGSPVSAFQAGGRFLDLSAGLAPDKFTAEVRRIAAVLAERPAASIAWSRSRSGPFQTIWEYDPKLRWRDGDAVDRVLPWPEVDRRIEVPEAGEIYVRYRVQDLAIDDFRLAVETKPRTPPSALQITHTWTEDGVRKAHSERIAPGAAAHAYAIDIPPAARVSNEAVILECAR